MSCERCDTVGPRPSGMRGLYQHEIDLWNENLGDDWDTRPAEDDVCRMFFWKQRQHRVQRLQEQHHEYMRRMTLPFLRQQQRDRVMKTLARIEQDMLYLRIAF